MLRSARILAALLSVGMFASCDDSSSDSSGDASHPSALVGSCSRTETEGGSVLTYTVTLLPDGRMVMSFARNGNTQGTDTISWSVISDNRIVTVADDDRDTASYSISGNDLSINTGSNVIVYTKVSAPSTGGAGTGGSTGGSTGGTDTTALVGTWYQSFTDAGVTYTAVTTFLANGTMSVLVTSGSKVLVVQSGTWSVPSPGKLSTVLDDEASEQNYSISGDTLVIDSDGESSEWKKQ